MFSQADLYPSSWFQQLNNSSILIRTYTIPTLCHGDLGTSSIITDLEFMKVRAILTYTVLRYVDMSHVKPFFTRPNAFRANAEVKYQTTPEGAFLILVSPLQIDGIRLSEGAVNRNIKSALALLLAVLGRNVAFDHVFDQEVYVDFSRLTVTSDSHTNPWWFGKPDVNEAKFDLIKGVDKAISSLEPSLQNRVLLSLRWLEMATYETGIDAFLKYWIAIESLGMPDTSDIKPVNKLLSKAYGLNLPTDANKKFLVGRIFGLRSKIVHDGCMTDLPAAFLLYMQAIYSDILTETLAIQSMRRAESVLALFEKEIRAIFQA